MKRTPLKGKLIDVWGFVLGFYEDHGVTPTRQEIADRFSITRQGAQKHVERLVKYKYVKLSDKSNRNITIVYARNREKH